MKKVSFGKPTATVSSNMNRKKIYVDSLHADSIKKNIMKQLNVLSKSDEMMGNLLNKMSYKNMFMDDVHSTVLQCSKKYHSLSGEATSIANEFEYQYNDDIKTCLIESLDERISYLENKLLNKE